jgi:hypothetical protein
MAKLLRNGAKAPAAAKPPAAPPTPTVSQIAAALAAYFDPHEVHAKPGAVAKDADRAMVLHYVDARTIIERLMSVLGLDGWRDRYDFLPSGSVVCTLRVRIGGKWTVRTDVGSPSEQEDEGDRLKAAVSDALKRAAVKLGCGLYLYRLPRVWADYDKAKKRFVREPSLPLWAIPGGQTARRPTDRRRPPRPQRPPQPARRLRATASRPPRRSPASPGNARGSTSRTPTSARFAKRSKSNRIACRPTTRRSCWRRWKPSRKAVTHEALRPMRSPSDQRHPLP